MKKPGFTFRFPKSHAKTGSMSENDAKRRLYDEKAMRRLKKKLAKIGECLIFTGAGGPEKRREKWKWFSPDRNPHLTLARDPLRFRYQDKLIHPNRVAFAIPKGLDPLKVRISSVTCGNPRCCHEEHLQGDVFDGEDPKMKFLAAMAYSPEYELTIDDLNQNTDGLVFTDEDVRRYLHGAF